MSLSFVFGPSGAGKSRWIYEQLIRRAEDNPSQNFLIIVPDQFTMQTQKEMVMLSRHKGIMNIDVLSFGRLHHRIMEEVGRSTVPVLDDTGKSLVLQKVAAGLTEELPCLGGYMHRQGYIHEVKSAISEFMQYGVAPEDISKLIAGAGASDALAAKLKDLGTVYAAFIEYIRDNFITTEEKLEVLCRALPKSKLLKNAVVVFDGFTGFTPIQYSVIGRLMELTEEVILTLCLGNGENPYCCDGEQKLFHLSQKTTVDLDKLACNLKVKRGQDTFLLPEGESVTAEFENCLIGKCRVERTAAHRFSESPALAHLEKNLFRFAMRPYEGEQTQIKLFTAMTPKEEIRQTGLKIHELIAEEGVAFRDIAVILGDLESYASDVETEFSQMHIPCYIDRTRGIVLNPMIEFIKSGIALFLHDFSYESVFHFLRSGMTDFTAEEIDLFENYILATGIRGRRKYERRFVSKRSLPKENAEEILCQINDIRERLLELVGMLAFEKEATAADYVNKLYDFLTANKVQNRLAAMEERFALENDAVRAREYAQIYRLVMELLEQVYGLLGEEKVTLKEFYEILEAGFGEIEVGTIPQNVDRVLVGDMERTRLCQVKYLFFLGVNDGNIPKSASKGGILSDMDRETLMNNTDVELAPGPRQQMFIQRLYLYLNMTKPSGGLFLSYAKVNGEGKSMREAYLIGMMKKLFPGLNEEWPELRSPLEQIVTAEEGKAFLAEGLREYAAGMLEEKRERDVLAIYHTFGEEERKEERDFLTRAAFQKYEESGLAKEIARALYGTFLQGTVSKLETFAACSYKYFLEYGLGLKERETYAFEPADMGNVYHEVLKIFSTNLEKDHMTWFDFTEDYAKASVNAILQSETANYGDSVLYATARSIYSTRIMERVLVRTVMTLQKHLKKGSFVPEGYEISFRAAEDLSSLNIRLSDEEKLRLYGRVDRWDLSEDEEKVYVKVIDYKSGNKQFDLAALYYGLQLQLVVYMNAVVEKEAKNHPGKEVVPAAMLYYHLDDPVVETADVPEESAILAEIEKQLKMKGVVTGEEEIVSRLDGEMERYSTVIPVERKKDGGYSAKSSVLSTEDMQTVSGYVTKKITQLGKDIVDGKIAKNPYEKGKEEKACKWCPYSQVCGFDVTIPGYEMRKIPEMKKEEVLQKMRDTSETQ